METKYTLIIAVALAAGQLTGCKSTQTYSNINSFKPANHLIGMGNKNTCNISNPTRAERKYLRYYDYCEVFEKQLYQNSRADIDNNSVGAGAPTF